MRILPVIREFTGMWRNHINRETLMLSEDEPGTVQALWYVPRGGRFLVLTGKLAVKAAVASGYVYLNGDAAPKPSWWQKLLRVTPKPRPWGTLTVHYINPSDLFVSNRRYNHDGSTYSYRLNAAVRTQIGDIDGA